MSRFERLPQVPRWIVGTVKPLRRGLASAVLAILAAVVLMSSAATALTAGAPGGKRPATPPDAAVTVLLAPPQPLLGNPPPAPPAPCDPPNGGAPSTLESPRGEAAAGLTDTPRVDPRRACSWRIIGVEQAGHGRLLERPPIDL